MKQFIVGRRYEVTSLEKIMTGCSQLYQLKDGKTFKVSAIDDDGDAWSEDVSFEGETLSDGEGWAIGSPQNLEDGSIVLLDE